MQRYIQVILPLKLEWEPWYMLRPEDPDVRVGERVRVKLSGREYVAVVCNVSGRPDIDIKKIRRIVSIEDALEFISTDELRFWRFISEYYLCTLGEVYKYVFPAGKTAVEARRANKKGAGGTTPDKPRLTIRHKEAVRDILDAFVSGKPVFLQSCLAERQPVYDELVRRTMESGKDVLILKPGSARESYVTQRELAKAVRGPAPVLVEGSRHNLFLPFTKLGLVIVDDEQDASYKQSTMAPRYNARDAAIALASRHKAYVLLTSFTPSFETLFNVDSLRYGRAVLLQDKPSVTPFIIGTGAEYNKKGMVGSLSRKLITRLEEVEGRKLLITPWDLEEPVKFRRLKTVKLSKVMTEDIGSYDLVALINAEALISRNDFRADERALQFLRWLESGTKKELIIQTRDTRHPLFSMDHDLYLKKLLEERRSFNYPPYSRMVEIKVADTNEARRALMTLRLTERLGGPLKQLLPKDKTLQVRKREICEAVNCFETENRYFSHIYIDVDP